MDHSKKVLRLGVSCALEELSLILIDEARAREDRWSIEICGLVTTAFIAFSSAISIAENVVENQAAVARDYRPAPPRNEHYYPTTGVKPKVGRAEDLLAPTIVPQPAEPYRRKF